MKLKAVIEILKIISHFTTVNSNIQIINFSFCTQSMQLRLASLCDVEYINPFVTFFNNSRRAYI